MDIHNQVALPKLIAAACLFYCNSFFVPGSSDINKRWHLPSFLAHEPGTGHEVYLYYFMFSLNFLPGLWIRIRIGSKFSEFVDPDPVFESGSGSRGNKLKYKIYFLVPVIIFSVLLQKVPVPYDSVVDPDP
jgi:hypothetical protein